jgi:GNAT superfamily N-acetyltransferase
MKKFDYIVAFYLGHRRSTFYNILGKENKLFLVNQHIKFLQTKPEGLNNIYFVFNTDGSTSHLSEEVETYIKTFPLNINVIFRDNINFSYGAWEEAIIENINNSTTSDYAFLIEDDYIPASPDSIQPFIERIQEEENVGYVAQLVSSNESANAADHGVIKHHASISNGLLNYSAVKDVLEKHPSVFLLNPSKRDYQGGVWNQVHFLNYIISSDYLLSSMDGEYLQPFYELRIEDIIFYGNKKGKILITPILSDITITPLIEEDLPFLLEIRNDESTRKFLENDSIFTLKECQEWFSTSNPEWYIISHYNTKVGYIRSTPNGEVGVDIHPNYRRKGYARRAYKEYLRYRKFATLWVFEDNFAKNLYQDLGFIPTGNSKKVRDRYYTQMFYYNGLK